MKIILNKTKNSRDRYTLINKGMGGFGLPENHPNNMYSVINGVDRGNGYQGYMSIDYFLSCDYLLILKSSPMYLKERLGIGKVAAQFLIWNFL